MDYVSITGFVKVRKQHRKALRRIYSTLTSIEHDGTFFVQCIEKFGCYSFSITCEAGMEASERAVLLDEIEMLSSLADERSRIAIRPPYPEDPWSWDIHLLHS